MMLRFIFYAFLLYIGYKLVFDFIIPVVSTTRRIRKQFNQAREQMEQQQQQQQYQQQGEKPENVTNGIGEYIEFEEIKK
jgi:Sec-independent protein translocase protein TatA